MEVKEEELMRMQGNLLQLRTENYDLRDKIVRITEENKGLKEKTSQLDRECERANRAISRSKKAKDVQVLQDDYDRMHATVTEFEQNATQQNQTLLNELANAMEENDKLKKSLSKDGRGTVEEFKVLEEELLHLRAENAVLKSSFQKDGDSEATGNTELELKVATQTEENRVLTKQLTESKQKYDDLVSELQGQVKQLELKTEHKQELIIALQNEKELVQYELKLKLENSQTETQNLKKELNISREKLTESDLKQELITLNSSGKVIALEQELEKMRSKVALVDPETVKEFETLKSERQKFRRDSKKETETIAALNTEKNTIDEKLKSAIEHTEKLRQSLSQRGEENQTLQDELKSNIDKVGVLQDEISKANSDLHRLQCDYGQAQKLADSRKAMLDEQSIENQIRIEDLFGKLNEKNRSNEIMIAEYQDERVRLETQIRDLKEQLEVRLNQERTVKKLEIQREELESKIASLENGISETKSVLEKEIKEVRAIHESEVGVLNEEVSELSQTVDEKERFILKFGQEKEELKLSFRIGEKRNLLMIKELKKQLLHEQKRCQKFQEQMSELRQTSFTESMGDEQESVSIGRNCDSALSWNKSSSNLTLNETPIQEETKDLIDRLTTIQQQKWILEEKCSHLEDSNSALNNDLLRKESIIKTYVVSHKADLNPKVTSPTPNKSVSRKLLNFVIPEDDEYKDESFRKVQRALEEEMTKNIHLKENLETLMKDMAALEARLSEEQRQDSEN
ncbi:GRIP1-associated protein 1-like [Oopsacas minuta]|uniref:GRIP1-associated protein 1-like n=1 Tax=Oopsacas minuta TaxID=111878 RepID=A0AAV7JDG0_9METZ|nr:GRIP1-associated protein 1-like [Oopsacas minuta]